MSHRISISKPSLSLALVLTLLLALPAAGMGSHTQSGTWLEPIELGEAIDAYCTTCEFVGAAMNQSGDAAAVWYGASGAAVGAATRQRGSSWVVYPDISEGNGANDGVQVEMDSVGNAYAVWIAAIPLCLCNKVQGATYTPGFGWSPPFDITGPSPVVHQYWGPMLAVNSAATGGSATVVWYQMITDVDIRVMSSTLAPGGSNQWWPPEIVSEPGQAESFPMPDVGMDASGNATAVWKGAESGSLGAQIWVATRPPGPHAVWTGQHAISPSNAPPYWDDAPAISVNHAGEAAAAWVAGGSIESRHPIWAATRSAGRWSPAQRLSSTTSSYAPQIAIDQHGTATAAWFAGIGTPQSGIETSDHPSDGTTWTPSQIVSRTGRWNFSLSLADPYMSTYRSQLSWAAAIPGSLTGIFAATRTAQGGWVQDELDRPGIGSEVAGDGHGNGVAVLQSATGHGDFAKAVGYDDAGPQIDSVSLPPYGYVGEPVSFSVERTDVWSEVASDVWDFGDGETDEGQQVEHTYQQAGAYGVSVTSTDSLGHPTTSPTQEITILDHPSPHPSHVGTR